MEDDGGLLKTEQGSTSHLLGYVQHCHHLRYLGRVLDMYHAVLD